ncbi:MAG: hypothetical protein ACRECH_10285 [Nitrososphaerales archaeon]
MARPSVLFWPLGNPELETAQEDAKVALMNLGQADLDIRPVERMTWCTPSEIPKLARSVKKKDLDAVVVFSATHGTVRCITAIVKRFKLPAVIWAIPSRYSLATSGIAKSYLGERGYFTRLLCNAPNDDSVRPQIETIARAARASREAKTRRIGIIGNLSPLMISLPYNLPLLKKKLGPKTVKIGLPSLENKLESISDSDVHKEVSKLKEKYQINVGGNTLAKAVRFQLAVREIVKKNRLDAIALECWTKLFPKYGVNPCLGHLDDLVVGCEGDVVSMSGSLILMSINGVNPYLADIFSVDPKRNLIELSHCAAPISLASDASKINIVERTDPKSAGKTAFANFKLKNGAVTLVRFYGRNLDKIHMTFGELKDTGEYWGGMRPVVELKGNAAEFLRNVSGNHYLLTYGDVREELRVFAELHGLQVRED